MPVVDDGLREEIEAILDRGRFTYIPQSKTTTVEWGSLQDKARAFAIAFELGARIDPHSDGCPTCHIEAVNTLRRAVGRPDIAESLPEKFWKARMAICKTCPAYHWLTRSCGRLGIDHFGLLNKPVMIDGRMVKPCGCEIDLKSRWITEKCPANKWPNHEHA